jgi:hypothetical protein
MVFVLVAERAINKRSPGITCVAITFTSATENEAIGTATAKQPVPILHKNNVIGVTH